MSYDIPSKIKARLHIEKLYLLRSSGNYKAYLETFRETLIDANPHQIDAVMFALERIKNLKGCILADEVGLGKTIEAGLVISQFLSERKWNILIILPTSLSVQWQIELKDLLNISSKVISTETFSKIKSKNKGQAISEDGIYIMGRELASSRVDTLLEKSWDLIIVDEAHEMFSSIHQRYNSTNGSYSHDSKKAIRAGNLRQLLIKYPVLLLTATPIQNNILELWSLASYINPKGDILGLYHHFRKLFLGDSGGTTVKEDKINELRERLSNVMIRNLRKDAQLFMQYKFTDRICKTENFNMNEEEKSLYNDISDYLSRNDIYAFRSTVVGIGNEQIVGRAFLMKMTYRRLLGSSIPAVRSGLSKIIIRLNKLETLYLENIQKESDETDEMAEIVSEESPEDFEEDKEAVEQYLQSDSSDDEVDQVTDIDLLREEIALLEGYLLRCDAMKETSKERAFLKIVQAVLKEDRSKVQDKIIIFTQFLATQRKLADLLLENGFEGKITLFSGSNKGENVDQAVKNWTHEVGNYLERDRRPQGEAMIRQSLIHQFETRSNIFISTEAGAKGLNLQFANVLINFDLPWNPQRIEQRIGRCHRYGQKKDVLVFNFVNIDNSVETRVYEILNSKFSLFSGILGVSNDILGSVDKAINFEVRINEMLNACKTEEQIEIMFKKLEEEIDEETKQVREGKIQNTKNLINRLDRGVKDRLKLLEKELPEGFSQYDTDLLNLIKEYSAINGLHFVQKERTKEQIILELSDNGKNLSGKSHTYHIGKMSASPEMGTQLNLKHHFIQKAVEEIKNKTNDGVFHLLLNNSENGGFSILNEYLHKNSYWYFYKILFSGLEEEEKLFHIIVCNGDQPVVFKEEEVEVLLKLPIQVPEKHDDKGFDEILPIIDKEIDRRIDTVKRSIQEYQQPRLSQKLNNLRHTLGDTKEYYQLDKTRLEKDLHGVERKISETFDRDEGEKLIHQKGRLQGKINDINRKLLEYETEISNKLSREENNLLSKRFVTAQKELIFKAHFQIT